VSERLSNSFLTVASSNAHAWKHSTHARWRFSGPSIPGYHGPSHRQPHRWRPHPIHPHHHQVGIIMGGIGAISRSYHHFCRSPHQPYGGIMAPIGPSILIKPGPFGSFAPCPCPHTAPPFMPHCPCPWWRPASSTGPLSVMGPGPTRLPQLCRNDSPPQSIYLARGATLAGDAKQIDGFVRDSSVAAVWTHSTPCNPTGIFGRIRTLEGQGARHAQRHLTVYVTSCSASACSRTSQAGMGADHQL
jgi:hypothetical protein